MSLIQAIESTVMLVGNGVNIRMTGGEPYEDDGSYSNYDIQVGASYNPVTGDTLTIEYGDNELVFIFRDTPLTDGLSIHTRPGGYTFAEYIALVMEDFKANFFLDRDFTISLLPGNYINFFSKEPGIAYNISFSSSPVTIIALYLSENGTDPVMRENYKVGCAVYMASNEEELGRDHKDVDDSGNVSFDVAEYCNPELECDFTKPNSVSALLVERPNICKEFYNRFYEYYGDPAVVRKMVKGNPFCVLKGGLNKYTRAYFQETGNSFYNYINVNKHFLSFQPKTKDVYHAQDERLFFLNYSSSVTSVKLYAVVTTTTVSHSPKLLGTVVCGGNYRVYEAITTPDKVIEYLNATYGMTLNYSTIYNIRFYINDQNGNKISEDFIYTIDKKYYGHNRFFIFQNSLGGWDTLRTKGEGIKSEDYEKQSVYSFFGIDNTTADHEIYNERALERESITVNTGWIKDKQEVDWLRELFLSEKVYQIIDGYIFPVFINSKAASIYKDNNYNYNLEFEIALALEDRYYSNWFELNVLAGIVYDSDDYDSSDYLTERDESQRI